LRETDELPECPNCGTSRFRRDSIFESMQDHGMQDHGNQATREFALPAKARPPEWLREARESISRPGHHLVFCHDDGEITIFSVERGWTRIGRSATADVRLDHPSVSRRHALIVAEPAKDLRVLDDRSLNGVFVNGEKVEWGTLCDGDELTVGCFSLYALQA
jgi:hypothetical protein